MRIIRPLMMALAMVASLSAAPATAYGGFGHVVIARIAIANVRPSTRAAITALVAKARAVDTPTCATATVEDLSVWPDCIRALGPRFSYTASWHYQNVDVCAAFDLKSACRDGNCASAQIDRDVKLIRDKSLPLRERIAALAFLIHFVGDLHMPLHAGDHRDLGGNQVRASYGIYATDRLNLHAIWDGALAERAITDGDELVRRYDRATAGAIQAGATEDWSHEAWEVSRTIAYASALGEDYCTAPPGRPVTLDAATVTRLIPIARLQVERAGLRLARLLDEAFA